LHELLEREGRGRARTLLIGQEHFDGLTQEFWLACCFDGLQTGLGCSPAFSPQPHRVMIYVQVLGDLRHGRSCCCCQHDLPSPDQPLGTGCATHQPLQQVLLQRTDIQRGCAWIGHDLVLLLPDLLSLVYHILPTYFSEAVLA